MISLRLHCIGSFMKLEEQLNSLTNASEKGVRIIPAGEIHRNGWNRLFAGYAEFYEHSQTEAERDRVWGWIISPHVAFWALIAIEDHSRPLGFVHLREDLNPLRSCKNGYLCDLFVDPGERRRLIGKILLQSAIAFAKYKQWRQLNWHTHKQNKTARGLYDQFATVSDFQKYDVFLDKD